MVLRRAHIANQLPVARLVLTCQDCARLHSGMGRQCGFNFAQFYAVAADLHLVVCAAQVFQDSVSIFRTAEGYRLYREWAGLWGL